MGILSRIFGTEQAPEQGQAGQSEDERALARYRYMLKTAPPETIEQAHAEAFAQLTPEQRRMALQQLSAAVPEAERAAAAQGGDAPQTLARMATRAEVRQPGTLERMFGGMGGGMGGGVGGGGIGLGGLMAGSFLSTIAGTVVGSMIAHQFFSHDTGFAGGEAGGDQDQASGAEAGEGDPLADDTSGATNDGDLGDMGGDMGDIGGDL